MIGLLAGIFTTALCLLILNPARVATINAQEPDPEELFTSFIEWKAKQPPPQPLRVWPIYQSEVREAQTLTGSVVLMLINPAIYPGIADAVDQWITDVEGEDRAVILQLATFPDPPALRAHLADMPGLGGLILVGDFPVPWYELDGDAGHKEFPFDIYYMDLDGVWGDIDADGLFDSHSVDIEPEIWVGRLTASPLTYGGSEVDLLNNYFTKNHAYRSGDLRLPARALAYIDDDWYHPEGEQGQHLLLTYPEAIVIREPEATTAADYKQRLLEDYGWIHVYAHSTAWSHSFKVDAGTITSEEMYHIDPHAFFYNLFSCGPGRFIETDYLAGWYTFADTYGLATIASSKSGSMVREFDDFHSLLGKGDSLGHAFKSWFEVWGVADIGWHYGLVIIGDPTLTIRPFLGNAPAEVTISGVSTGSTNTPHAFTATVAPLTSTQPIWYTWEVTGQSVISHTNTYTDTVSFNWWQTSGPQLITVTAINPAGMVTNTHLITIADAEIELSPATFSQTLPLMTRLSQELVISNTGLAPLSVNLLEAKYFPDPTGGPDLFGYTFKDSTELHGPLYQWIEIAPPEGGSGTELSELTGDWHGYVWPITMSFSFNYYGQDYTKLGVSPQGALYFEDLWMTYQNAALPSVDHNGPKTFIAPLWTYQFIVPGAIYVQDFGSKFVVEFYQVSRPGSEANPITWQVILYENGNILAQYKDMVSSNIWLNEGRTATVGLQGNTMVGLQYSYNTPIITDGLAICFAYPGNLPDCSAYEDIAWLAPDSAPVTIPPNSSSTVGVTFDAGVPAASTPGQYQAVLVAVSNDTDDKLVPIPVTMTVIERTHGLALEPTSATAQGKPGTAVTYTLHVTNTGNVTDIFELVALNNDWPTSLPATAGPLDAGEKAAINVVVAIPANPISDPGDSVTVTVISQGERNQQAVAILTTTANITYGLDLNAPQPIQLGNPGTDVIHVVQITNTGTVPDSFNLNLGGNTWPTTGPATIGPLAAGQTTSFTIEVAIPTNFNGSVTDTARLTVTSQGDGNRFESMTLHTTAVITCGVAIAGDSDTQLAAPAGIFTYTVYITNTGNIAESYSLAATSDVWSLAVPPTIGPLGRGESDKFLVSGAIPAGPVAAISSSIVITATSQIDPAVWDSIIQTIQIEARPVSQTVLYLPLILK